MSSEPSTSPPSAAVESRPELVLPLKLQIVKNDGNGAQFSADEIRDVVEKARQYWHPAGIRLECLGYEWVEISTPVLEDAYPNLGREETTHKPACSELQLFPSYDPLVLNVFLVRRVTCWRSEKSRVYAQYPTFNVLLVGEKFAALPPAKGLATGIGAILGLSFPSDPDPSRLYSLSAEGSELTADEIDRARTQVKRRFGRSEIGSKLINTAPMQLPLKLHVVRNGPHALRRDQASLQKSVDEVQAIWKKAGISFDVTWSHAEIAPEVLEQAFPNSTTPPEGRRPSCMGLMALRDYSPASFNLFIVKAVLRVGSTGTQPILTYPGGKLGVVSEAPRAIPAEKALAFAIGEILGLQWSDGPVENFTTPGTPGTQFTIANIEKVRSEAAVCFSPPSSRGDLRVIYPPANDTLEKALAELDALVGLKELKSELLSLANFLRIEGLRRQRSLGEPSPDPLMLHILLTGNPGTGKTTVARLLGRIFKAVGGLAWGHMVETDRSVLVGETGARTCQRVNEAADLAMGGVLFVDEANSLSLNNVDANGNLAVTTLIKRMEDNRDKFAVVLAGQEDEMLEFVTTNTGLQSRVRHHFHFPDHDPKELATIFLAFAKQRRFVVGEAAQKRVLELMEQVWRERDKTFGNGRLVRNLFEDTMERQADRLVKLKEVSNEELFTLGAADIPERGPLRWKGSSSKRSWDPNAIVVSEPPLDDSLEKVMLEIDRLVGLASVKRQIRSLIDFFGVEKRRHDEGLSSNPISLHMIFRGAPGTGKTTVARLMGRLFKALNLLARGQVLETDRSGLVAGWVGQTSLKTNEAVDRATHGVLFIDEAYALIEAEGLSHNWGREAVNTLMKRMEDSADRLSVIAAGYSAEMDRFLVSNPGLQSRFNHKLTFESYSCDELLEIFNGFCHSRGFVAEPEAQDLVGSEMLRLSQGADGNFGNGRLVRNLFERTLERQATRLAQGSCADLTMLTVADIATDMLAVGKDSRKMGFRLS